MEAQTFFFKDDVLSLYHNILFAIHNLKGPRRCLRQGVFYIVHYTLLCASFAIGMSNCMRMLFNFMSCFMDLLIYVSYLILISCGLQRLLIVSSHVCLIGFGLGMLHCIYPIFVSSWSNSSMMFRFGDPLLFMVWRMRCVNEWSPLASFVWGQVFPFAAPQAQPYMTVIVFLASLGCAVSNRLANERHIWSGSFVEVICNSETWILVFGPLVPHSKVHHTQRSIVLTVGRYDLLPRHFYFYFCFDLVFVS